MWYPYPWILGYSTHGGNGIVKWKFSKSPQNKKGEYWFPYELKIFQYSGLLGWWENGENDRSIAWVMLFIPNKIIGNEGDHLQ